MAWAYAVEGSRHKDGDGLLGKVAEHLGFPQSWRL